MGRPLYFPETYWGSGTRHCLTAAVYPKRIEWECEFDPQFHDEWTEARTQTIEDFLEHGGPGFATGAMEKKIRAHLAEREN